MNQGGTDRPDTSALFFRRRKCCRKCHSALAGTRLASQPDLHPRTTAATCGKTGHNVLPKVLIQDHIPGWRGFSWPREHVLTAIKERIRKDLLDRGKDR